MDRVGFSKVIDYWVGLGYDTPLFLLEIPSSLPTKTLSKTKLQSFFRKVVIYNILDKKSSDNYQYLYSISSLRVDQFQFTKTYINFPRHYLISNHKIQKD